MTTPRPVLRPALAAVALLVAGPACSPDEVDAGAASVGTAGVADEMASLFSRLSPGSADSSRCFGEALAARRTVGQLREAGLLDEDGRAPEQMPTLRREDAAAWVDAWFGCVDYVELAARAQQKTTPRLDVPAFEACLEDNLTGDLLREAATDGLSGDTTSIAVRRLGQAQFACARRHD